MKVSMYKKLCCDIPFYIFKYFFDMLVYKVGHNRNEYNTADNQSVVHMYATLLLYTIYCYRACLAIQSQPIGLNPF